MEVSEAISVQAKPTELGFHQPPSPNNGDSDHETSDHRHDEEGGVGDAVEIGLPQPRASSNGDSDSATSDLVLAEQIASLDLKENEGGSPRPDSEVKTEATEEEIESRSKSDQREDSIENELREEKEEGEEEESIGEDFGGEGIGNGETVEDENEGLKEFEVINGVDELEKKDEKFNARKYIHPVRPEAEDCAFYLKTGNCKFGNNCKFNHPVRKKPNHLNHQAAKERIKEKEKEKEKEELPEKSVQSNCKFYLRSGGCKYGKGCKYNHPRAKPTPSVAPVVELNFVGLPIRMGEKECPYYMRTGLCKYGVHCRFHHPNPTDAAAGSETSIGYGNGGSQSNMETSWLSPRSMNEVSHSSSAPFVLTMNPPTQRALSPNSEWNGYQAPVYLPPERNMPLTPTYSMKNMTTENLVDDYPERPDQPNCSYFLKTGVCKYRSNCKYHHPKARGLAKITAFTLSDKGLPLRPDQIICTHYSRYGICKYGPACKYDHSEANLSSAGDNQNTYGHNQNTYGHSESIEGAGMTRSGSRSEVTIQQ